MLGECVRVADVRAKIINELPLIIIHAPTPGKIFFGRRGLVAGFKACRLKRKKNYITSIPTRCKLSYNSEYTKQVRATRGK